MKVTDERLGQLSESQISQPILLPDELSEILANLSVSPDTALRHIDALMGAEFTDMLVHEGCEDDAAVCESDPKESASFVSTRLRPTAFASYSIAQGLVRASTMFIPLTIGRNNSNKNKSHYLNIVT